MKSILFIVLFFSIVLPACSQSELLNQVDSSGKKDGKWVVFLDKNWKEAKKPSETMYTRYTYFDQGTNIYPMGKCGGKNYKLIHKNDTGLVTNDTRILDGEYAWFDSNGKLSSVHIFKNGVYVSCNEYHSNGNLSQHFDYAPKIGEQLHTYSIYLYDKNGNLSQTVTMQKDENGHWRVTR